MDKPSLLGDGEHDLRLMQENANMGNIEKDAKQMS